MMSVKKKKIAVFFDCTLPHVGGIGKSLSNFLWTMDYNLYDIDLYALGDRAFFLEHIPEQVCVKYISFYKSAKILGCFKRFNLTSLMILVRSLLIRLILFCSIHKIIGRILSRESKWVWWQFMRPLISKFKIKYDLAIAYSPDMFSLSFVIEKLNSAKKVTCIHTEISAINDSSWRIRNLKAKFASLNHIFFVSDSALRSAASFFPEYSDKFIVVRNIINIKEVRRLAHDVENVGYDREVVNIVTIARVYKQKGIDLAVDACRILRQKGYRLCWYIVGEIHCKEYIRIIESKGASDYFILLGDKCNPLPYIDQCDIYVQPSLSEGYCMALDEALMLNKPVVVTDLPVFRNRLIDMKTALFAELTPESLAEKIEMLIKDKALRDYLSNNTKELDFDTTAEIEKMYKIINN